MLSFTIQDLDNALQDRDSTLATSTTFAARRTSAAKQAMADFYANYQSANNLWGRSSTLSGAAVALGAAVAAVGTLANIYRVPLVTGQRSVADNTLLLEQSTTVFVPVPRLTVDQIVVTGTPTSSGFYEDHNEIVLYILPSVMTGSTGTIHYNYWRDPTIDTSTSTNAIDIDPNDFPDFCNTVYSLMTAS